MEKRVKAKCRMIRESVCYDSTIKPTIQYKTNESSSIVMHVFGSSHSDHYSTDLLYKSGENYMYNQRYLGSIYIHQPFECKTASDWLNHTV